jgi:hypothetical protein
VGGFFQRSKVAASNDVERSRRILRLVYANWLAQCDRPPAARAKVAVCDPITLYEPDPSAPYAARAIAPQVVARVLKTSLLARFALEGTLQAKLWEGDGPLALERTRQVALVAKLEEELRRREQVQSTTPRDPSR